MLDIAFSPPEQPKLCVSDIYVHLPHSTPPVVEWGMAIRVLLADTQPLFAEVLSAALHEDPDLDLLNRRPSDGPSTVRAVLELRPDVALIDYWLPGLRGPEVLSGIRQTERPAPVLTLSGLRGPAHIKEALEAGAVGFLPKGVSVAQVAEAIHRAHAGEVPVFATELRQDAGRRCEEDQRPGRRRPCPVRRRPGAYPRAPGGPRRPR